MLLLCYQSNTLFPLCRGIARPRCGNEFCSCAMFPRMRSAKCVYASEPWRASCACLLCLLYGRAYAPACVCAFARVRVQSHAARQLAKHEPEIHACTLQCVHVRGFALYKVKLATTTASIKTTRAAANRQQRASRNRQQQRRLHHCHGTAFVVSSRASSPSFTVNIQSTYSQHTVNIQSTSQSTSRVSMRNLV